LPRAWFFEHFDATTDAELAQRYPPESKERHQLAEFRDEPSFKALIGE